MEARRLLQTSLTLLILVTSSCGGHKSRPALKLDQALLTFHNKLTEEVQVFYTSDFCYKCVPQHLLTVKPNNNNASAVINTKFTLTIGVETGNVTVCRWSQMYGEGGHFSVWIQMSEGASNLSCNHAVDKTPHNAYLPLLAAALLLAIIALLFIVVPFIYRRPCTSKCMRTLCCKGPQYSMDSPGGHAPEAEPDTAKAKPKRLRSLDTFRGFALTVMVFVNYGGGGYWFFQHAPWNGLTVADVVMPWFVFIIGTSVVLAFTLMQRRGVSRLQLLRKISWRTVALLMLGFCFINYSPRDGPQLETHLSSPVGPLMKVVDGTDDWGTMEAKDHILYLSLNKTTVSWSWLRIPGVLQHLGFTYFVLSLLQTFWCQTEIPQTAHHWWNPIKDVVLYWPQWLIIAVLETLWLCITFLMPVPNCPTGYLGAGGIGDDGLYPNCTGGAAGYIDRWMFGDNLYRYPTCREMYHTTQPFDPEGVLGTLNAIVMGFMGMQAGKIIIFYKGDHIRILCRFLVWAVVLGIPAAILSKCTRDGGFIPVNKNLWSFSFVMCMGCLSFLLLGGMYFLIDVKGWWAGQPFVYPGMNSIFVYVCHSLLGFYFPFSWEMRFQESHWEWLFQSLWGTALWVFISYLMYRKRVFLKI